MTYTTMLTIVLYACYFSGAVVTYALCGNKSLPRLIAALILGLVLALVLTPCLVRGDSLYLTPLYCCIIGYLCTCVYIHMVYTNSRSRASTDSDSHRLTCIT